jgi:hypothetical protein
LGGVHQPLRVGVVAGQRRAEQQPVAVRLVQRRYPLAEVAAAMELAESSGRTALGKIILVP